MSVLLDDAVSFADIVLRLYVVTAYLTTCLVCALRGWKSTDIRARIGNVAFGSTCFVVWLYQAQALDVPTNVFTVLLAVTGTACLVYLIVVARKGL